MGEDREILMKKFRQWMLESAFQLRANFVDPVYDQKRLRRVVDVINKIKVCLKATSPLGVETEGEEEDRHFLRCMTSKEELFDLGGKLQAKRQRLRDEKEETEVGYNSDRENQTLREEIDAVRGRVAKDREEREKSEKEREEIEKEERVKAKREAGERRELKARVLHLQELEEKTRKEAEEAKKRAEEVKRKLNQERKKLLSEEKSGKEKLQKARKKMEDAKKLKEERERKMAEWLASKPEMTIATPESEEEEEEEEDEEEKPWETVDKKKKRSSTGSEISLSKE